MSVLAQVMESVRFTEAQNKMILSGKISADRMAIMFNRPKRQIQRQRALLKKLEAET
ncbi:hypothetical protein D3C84_952280 [compost metagenome]